ncbi:SIR2 family protein [Vibrio alginolyticus]|nr:SIR2 family protein [Vibrio alginolyticus]
MKTLLEGLLTDGPDKISHSISASDFVNSKLINTASDTTFFTGAGFSKAWNDDYPLGAGLFSIDFENQSDELNFISLAESLHIPKPDRALEQKEYDKACYTYFCEIKFHLDIFKRYPSLLPSYLDSTLIKELEGEMKHFIVKRFIDTVGDSEFDLNSDENINTDIVKFFKAVQENSKSISFISTNYDYIIEKIFSSFDSRVFCRGIVNRHEFYSKNWQGKGIPLYKINGGFEVHSDSSGFYLDYEEKELVPNIILPSKEQNYGDKYFKSVFLKSSSKLRESNKLVFIGYSLPDEDLTIRFLLKSFIDCSSEHKEIFVISKDTEGAMKIREKVANLFPNLAENDAIWAVEGSFIDICNALESVE